MELLYLWQSFYHIDISYTSLPAAKNKKKRRRRVRVGVRVGYVYLRRRVASKPK